MAKTPQTIPVKKTGSFARFLRRFLLLVFTLALLLAGGLTLILGTVFNGPSPAARNNLTMSLLEDSRTSWIPGLFLEDALIAEIAAEHGG